MYDYVARNMVHAKGIIKHAITRIMQIIWTDGM
jgi:hypothetical protein